MGFYSEVVLPRITNSCCGTSPVAKQREKVVPLAKGTVLEVGFGSGLNLPFYDSSNVERLFALEPSPGMRRLAAERRVQRRVPLDHAATRCDDFLGGHRHGKGIHDDTSLAPPDSRIGRRLRRLERPAIHSGL